MALKRNVDPVLEKLRNEIEGPPNLDTLALNTQRLTSNVHAAYLFEKEGTTTLRQLCLLLSATASGKLYSGWQEFATRLGLSLEQIQCIDYDFKGLQDPTYYVLLAFVQSSEATLDKILIALQKIGRFDIINRIHECMSKFIECLDLKQDPNGVSRALGCCEANWIFFHLVHSTGQTDQWIEEIHKPCCVPRAPLVLRPAITLNDELETRECDNVGISSETTKFDTHGKLQKRGPDYGSIVMLTYTEDGAITAKNIAKIFRAKEPRIGVLILQEQEKHVYSRAEEFVDDCFKQVNYVIPILTRGYIERINNASSSVNPMNNSLDSKYMKYIYSLLRFEYAKNNCCNNRVRCIAPENDVTTVIRSDLHPTLQAWFREADIDAFTDNILLRKI